MPDLIKKYQKSLIKQGWRSDEFQLRAVDELQRLLNELKPLTLLSKIIGAKPPQGIYLYGGVGRGKSMIMDLFFDEATKKYPKLKARRVHFHQFMIETHDWLHIHRGEGMDDLLLRYADDVADNIRLLCFDEFHVTDVADAMILGRLFTELFERGVVVVATSNWKPDDLYEGGLQRDLFKPFIDLLKKKMALIHLDNDTDYRTMAHANKNIYYFHPLNKKTQNAIVELFTRLSDNAPLVKDKITVKGRTIKIEAAANVARFKFVDICGKAHGAEDYIAIAKKYSVVFVEDIPQLSYERRNEIKRLILLVDCLYEANTHLVISAQTEMDKIYDGGDDEFEFQRTISRLIEMQSQAYHARRGFD